MEDALGLNEHHHNVLVNYVRFSNYQREQCLKTVKESFDNFRFSRLLEDTFTSDEVRDLIGDLSCMIVEDVKSDLLNFAHTVILLLCQMCCQAEQWCLNLQADTSELENKELLEKVGNFYEKLCSNNFDKGAAGSPIKLLTKLKPLSEDSGPNKLLMAEIERLKEENDKLSLRVKDVGSKAIEVIEEKSELSKALAEAQAELSKLREKEIDSVEEKMCNLEKIKTQLEADMEEKVALQTDLENSLAEAKQRLAQAEEQCQLTVKELEQKFSETTAYQNMKQILAAKNEQIKNLRRMLRELKSSDDIDNGDDDDESENEV